VDVEQARLPAIMWVSKPMTRQDRRACLLIIPIAAAAQRLAAPAALAPDQCRSLLDSLAQITDPATGEADGIHWSACSASRSARCWSAPGPWPPLASGPATRPARSWPASGSAATR
jgi:hypothetical protein